MTNLVLFVCMCKTYCPEYWSYSWCSAEGCCGIGSGQCSGHHPNSIAEQSPGVSPGCTVQHWRKTVGRSCVSGEAWIQFTTSKWRHEIQPKTKTAIVPSESRHITRGNRDDRRLMRIWWVQIQLKTNFTSSACQGLIGGEHWHCPGPRQREVPCDTLRTQTSLSWSGNRVNKPTSKNDYWSQNTNTVHRIHIIV